MTREDTVVGERMNRRGIQNRYINEREEIGWRRYTKGFVAVSYDYQQHNDGSDNTNNSKQWLKLHNRRPHSMLVQR